ncbi:hypothetical protein, variant [Sphaeroforma arctica JP610]|uniref:Glycosyl hydrolases family 38 C-terminal domain-containing protein n=1 Tax=Sphaeroforma arctica JP610 TaxID=667725 RepID=A0A0L0FYY2_9EUKA|nr:hypothetical protein, variant [Sphaeroforma arctica JP610]KNC81771.1 hypothetical protein, variant [Sphaeroforma arctica JP610]|eukprot:XP_014155673.1 hypothetical protein, variant [Sphaeroforma arctica JP610]
MYRRFLTVLIFYLYICVRSLPENIHLQSLEILRAPDVLLVRFENIMTTDENGGQNDVVCFNVRDVFNEDIVGKIVGAQEVSLTANTKKERYYLSRDDKKLPKSCPASTPSELLVALAPMEIVTLELQVA